jgi:hypothetical protein
MHPKRNEMKIEKGTYVIGTDGKKNWLLQVTSVNEGMVYGHLDADRAYNPGRGEFDLKKIVSVLGMRPHHGSAYGITIEPFLQTLVHPDWGNVHIFVSMTKDEKVAIRKALDSVYSMLKKKRLVSWIQAGALETEIRPAKGKYTGMYHYRTKNGEALDRMTLRPKMGVPLDYVIAHESAHGIWYRTLTRSQQARWIRLYHSYTKMLDFSPNDIRKLRDEYVDANEPVKDFRGQLEEARVLLFDNLLGTLTSNTRLTHKHLDTLAENSALDTIKDVWPQHIEDSDFEIAVTEYGTKNPEEFFAESFAYWLTGNKLPKRIIAAIEKTMSKASG